MVAWTDLAYVIQYLNIRHYNFNTKSEHEPHSSYIRNFVDFQLGNSHPHGHQNELAPPPCRIQYLEMAVEIAGASGMVCLGPAKTA